MHKKTGTAAIAAKVQKQRKQTTDIFQLCVRVHSTMIREWVRTLIIFVYFEYLFAFVFFSIEAYRWNTHTISMREQQQSNTLE